MSGGHYVGFYLAILGLIALVLVTSRPAVIRRLGSSRWPVTIVSIFAFVFLAIFGSGSREISFHTVVGPRDEVLARIQQNHVDAALGEILRPGFVRYMVRLDGSTFLQDGERLARALSVRVGTTVDLAPEGYRFDPPPELGQTFFFVSYVDRENALLAHFRGDGGIRRMELAERIVRRVLPQAAAIVALRMAKTDAEKLSILRENPFVMPYAAEWILDELGKIAQGASPDIVLAIEQKRAYVREYVKNPKMRDVMVEDRVDPP